jgi:hypothetical protein
MKIIGCTRMRTIDCQLDEAKDLLMFGAQIMILLTIGSQTKVIP